MSWIDLHGHARTGSWWAPWEAHLLPRVIRETMGRNAVWGLGNFNDDRYEKFARLVARKRPEVVNIGNALYFPREEVYIVKAQEVPDLQNGHLLVAGLEEGHHITPGRSLAEIVAEADQANGADPIIVAAHPCSAYWGWEKHFRESPEELLLLDGVEVFNGQGNIEGLFEFAKGDLSLRDINEAAQEFYIWALEYNPSLVPTSFSDSHSIAAGSIGGSRMEIPDPKVDEIGYISSAEEMIAYLKDGLRANKEEGLGVVQTEDLNGAAYHVLQWAGIKPTNALGNLVFKLLGQEPRDLIPNETRRKWFYANTLVKQ